MSQRDDDALFSKSYYVAYARAEEWCRMPDSKLQSEKNEIGRKLKELGRQVENKYWELVDSGKLGAADNLLKLLCD